MQNQVFISYSSKDAALANKIVEFLESQEYPCWIAPRNITSGHDYTDMINDAILHCRAVVLIVSSRALQSQWVKKELTTAVSYNKPVIPYRISNVEITGGLQFLLNNVQWIDAAGNPEGRFPDLVDGLEQRLSNTAPPPRKHPKTPLIVGLSSAVLLAAGGFLLWQRNTPTEGLPDEDTVAAVVPTVDTVVKVVEVPRPERVTAPTEPVKNEKRTTTSTQKKVAVEEVAQEVAPEPASAAEEAPAVVPDTAGQAAARRAAEAAAKAKAKELAFQNKKKEALKCYNTQRYREALNLFRELQREKPQDRDINAYISACQKQL